MQLDKRKVEHALCAKGFQVDDTHHQYFIYYTIDGLRTAVKTYTSHGPHRELDDHLINQMSKQCKLKKSAFIDLVQCPLSRADYEEMLRDSEIL